MGEDQVLSHLIHAATRDDIADLRNETKADISRLDTKIDREFEKVDERFDKLDKKIDSNFKWTLAIILPFTLATFGSSMLCVFKLF